MPSQISTLDPTLSPGPTVHQLAVGPVPRTTAGRWCRVVVRMPAQTEMFLISMALDMANGATAGAPVFLSRHRKAAGEHATRITHVPDEATAFVIDAIGKGAPSGNAVVSLVPLRPTVAALLLIVSYPHVIGKMVLAGLRGRWRQARHELIRVAMMKNANTHPHDYQLWLATYEPRPSPDPAGPLPGPMAALVFGDPKSAAFAATARSVATQNPPMPCLSASDGGAASLAPDAYAVVLQAGELLAPGSMAGACSELARLGHPAIATADHDRIDANGFRSDPTLTPTPNHALMLSGTLARGAWFIRAGLLPVDPAISEGGLWAEPIRLEAWLACYRAHEPGRTVRLPFILSHRLPETGDAPAALMARIVNAHLSTIGHGMRVRPVTYGALPALRLALPAPRQSTAVSVLIPSTLTAPHFLPCLKKLLAMTVTPEIEIVVAVGQAQELDDAQRRVAATAQHDRRVRVVHLSMPAFNYSTVTNRAAMLTRHPLLLLLNDDVAPIGPYWLDHMVAHMDDARIGVVGARLLYPAGPVQHGGIVMGLSGMCDHASRHLPGGATGPGARVVLDQELSAVTGACLLIRRTAFAAVGGLDETYPSAFNDVDLCLRIREAKWGVVYAGSIALTHYELQTYGSHYAGEREPYREAEIARFRWRWANEVAVDPFHNPNLGLVAGAEWDLTFPPRTQLWRAVEPASEFYSAPCPPDLTPRPFETMNVSTGQSDASMQFVPRIMARWRI
jgi:GT2 family glycosyltransferase